MGSHTSEPARFFRRPVSHVIGQRPLIAERRHEQGPGALGGRGERVHLRIRPVDSKPVRTTNELHALLRSRRPGERVQLARSIDPDDLRGTADLVLVAPAPVP